MNSFIYLLSCVCGFLGHLGFAYTLTIYIQENYLSSFWSGSMYFVLFLPTLFLTLFAGALADSVSRKKMTLIAQFCTGALVFLLAFLQFRLSVIPLLLILSLVLVYGCFFAFIPSSRISMSGLVVPNEQLEKLSIQIDILGVLAFGIHPILVGFLNQQLGWLGVFCCLGALLFLSNGILFFVKLRAVSRSVKSSTLTFIKEGLTGIFDRPLLIRLMLMLIIVYVTLVGPYQNLIPQYTREVLGLNSLQQGQFMALFGGGLICGGILALFVKKTWSRWLLILVTMSISASAWMFLPHLDLLQMLPILFLCGALGGLGNALIFSQLQVHTPETLRGRITSVNMLLGVGMPALGSFISGILAHIVGVTWGLVFMGVLGVLWIVTAGVIFSERIWGRRPQAPGNLGNEAIFKK